MTLATWCMGRTTGRYLRRRLSDSYMPEPLILERPVASFCLMRRINAHGLRRVTCALDALDNHQFIVLCTENNCTTVSHIPLRYVPVRSARACEIGGSTDYSAPGSSSPAPMGHFHLQKLSTTYIHLSSTLNRDHFDWTILTTDIEHI